MRPSCPHRRRALGLIAAVCVAAALACDAGRSGDTARDAAPPAMTHGQPHEVAVARGTLLVAAEKLDGSSFARTLVLLLHYGPEGAVGLVVNRPTSIELNRVAPELPGHEGREDVVHYGGPVLPGTLSFLADEGAAPAPHERICQGVRQLSDASDVARALGQAGVVRAYAGHAGWAPGQLDRELARGDWYVVACDAATVFAAGNAGADAARADAVWQELIDWLTLPTV